MKVGAKVIHKSNDTWNGINMKLAYIPPDGWRGKISWVDPHSNCCRIDNWWIGGLINDNIQFPHYNLGYFSSFTDFEKI